MKLMRLPDWIILFLGLLSTIMVTFYVHQKNQKEDKLRFEYETNFLLRRFQNRMDSYEGTLIQLRAFLKSSETISRPRLKKFIRDTEIFERFPGLQGLGYSLMIKDQELPEHLALMRKEIPGYRVFPEAPRKIYSSIIVLEPEDRRNLKAIGYDMFYESTRREAMEKARDTNSAVMTKKVILIQEDEHTKKLGFLIYLPHYKEQADLSTVSNRRAALLGYAYSPFRASELFRAMFSEMDMVLDLEIYDDQMRPQNKYFDYDQKVNEDNLSQVGEVTIFEKKLIFKTSPLPTFKRASSLLKSFLVFFTGLVITFLIYSYYLIMKKQMHLARSIAEEKERLLEKEKEHVIARDDFLSIASHELKTPLTSLKLQAQVILRAIKKNDPGSFTPEKIANFVKLIDNQTTRLTRLVDDMLDISRIRTGRLKIEKEEVELSDVVNEVIERLRPQFIKNIGAVPLKELETGIIGHWDRFRLEQVLTNLFTNAIRYGNGRPVKIKIFSANGKAMIHVIDQGIGIAKENTDKIFERFERAGVSANEISGLGLGLFITNQIIMAHGGHIHVESELGQGSTFIIELPV
jgi:two-component system, OmpR family, sensor kinase